MDAIQLNKQTKNNNTPKHETRTYPMILKTLSFDHSKIGFLKSKPGTLRQNFPKLFTDEFTEQFNWDGIGENKFAIRHRVFISHILYGLCGNLFSEIISKIIIQRPHISTKLSYIILSAAALLLSYQL